MVYIWMYIWPVTFERRVGLKVTMWKRNPCGQSGSITYMKKKHLEQGDQADEEPVWAIDQPLCSVLFKWEFCLDERGCIGGIHDQD